MVLTKNKKTVSIRPQTLKDYIGQASIKKTLDVLLTASKMRKDNLGHLLFYGQAGCQPAGQKVLMSSGEWKDVRDIKIGDEVISPQLNNTTINAKVVSTKKYISEIHNVIVGKKREGTRQKINYGEYRVAKEHLLVCKCRNCGSFINKRADEFRKNNNDKFGVFSPAVNFAEKKFKIKPYHLGMIIGDASTFDSIVVHNTDKEVIKEIYKLAKEFNLHITKNGLSYALCGDIIKRRAGFNPLLNEIKALGLFKKNSHKKFIPKPYLLGSIKQRLELLAGLLDTDGHRCSNSTFEFVTSSTQLATDVYNLCKSLGFGTTKKEKEKSWIYNNIKKVGTYWSVNISPQEYSIPLRIKRKQHAIRNLKWKNARIKAMYVRKENKCEMVYGFTLNSPSEWYITNDWIITHNTGKTTIAKIIANEMGREVKEHSGSTITKPIEVMTIFSEIEKGDIVFIDEIHRLPRNLEEEIYPIMEDFKLETMATYEENGREKIEMSNIDLPKFTLIGATTRLGLLTAPLRSRFRNTFKMEDYTLSEMETIIKKSAYRLKINIDKGALGLLAKRSRYIPRIANNLLLNSYDYATVKKRKRVNYEIAKITLSDLKIDDLGLTEPDRKFLKIVAEKSKTRPIGVKSIAQILNEEVDIVEEIYEPYLLQLGFIDRMVNGRIITKKGLEYLKKK